MNDQERFQLARRAALLKLAASGALGAGGMLGLIRQAVADDGRAGFRDLKGTVTVNGKAASIGQIVRAGQSVVTEAGSQAIYVVGKDAFLQRENSELAFDGGATVATLRYVTGKILSVFGRGNKKLLTPTATIGIRGTGCYIEAEAVRTYFCLCYGTADVTPKSGPVLKETIRTAHHERPMYIGNQVNMPQISAAGVINHNDAELIMLENLVGRWPPFYGQPLNPY